MGLEISSNRLYAPLLLKKFWLKNHAYNIPDFTVVTQVNKKYITAILTNSADVLANYTYLKLSHLENSI